MFNMLPITGDSLPIGTFVLTYDDGPGPNTQPIAEYLSSMGIAATFFVVGEFAERQPGVLTRVRALGHGWGTTPGRMIALAFRVSLRAEVLLRTRCGGRLPYSMRATSRSPSARRTGPGTRR